MITHTAVRGSTLGELNLGEDFKDVEIRNHTCGDAVEKLYYSARLAGTNLHLYCGIDHPFIFEDHYPQREVCSSHKPVKKYVSCTHFVTFLSVYNFSNHLQHVITLADLFQIILSY